MEAHSTLSSLPEFASGRCSVLAVGLTDSLLAHRAGYVATGFWAGLTLGRAVLTPLNNWVGEKRVVFVYLALAICLEVSSYFGSSLGFHRVLKSKLECLLPSLYSSPSGSGTTSSATRSPWRLSACCLDRCTPSA